MGINDAQTYNSLAKKTEVFKSVAERKKNMLPPHNPTIIAKIKKDKFVGFFLPLEYINIPVAKFSTVTTRTKIFLRSKLNIILFC